MDPLRRALRTLIVEDSVVDAELLLLELKRGNFDTTFERVEDAESMHAALENHPWDIVLSDFSLPRFNALHALSVLKASGLDIPFIVISGEIGEEAATDALRAGACDFIVKGKVARLVPAIDRELREAKSRATLRRTEEQLRHAQKMEAIGRLAGGVAHDFNNVLSVILLNAGLLAEGIQTGEPDLGDVHEIKSAALRATELTKQLLAFGRQQVLEVRIVDLNQVIVNLEMMLRRLIGADVELTTSLVSELGRVEVDVSQVEQVLVNLVVNARDAMPAGGRISITTEDAVLDEEYASHHVDVKPGPYVRFSVTDTGMGMDRATMTRAFEPFFTTKEDGRGTGLGLSTVFGIVKQSGGHIAVTSTPGGGTSFGVYLPRTDRTTMAGLPTPPAIRTLRGTETILLLEDDDQVRNVIVVLLRRSGYQVIEVRGAVEALAICDTHPKHIDLLLTDVVMPRMSGQVVAHRMRQSRPTLKVLLMSGYTNGSVVQHGLFDSSLPFLQKPILPDSLLRKLREVLDQPRAPDGTEP